MGAVSVVLSIGTFIVEDLAKREPAEVRRARPLPVALQNQHEDLLALAHDAKLTDIAQAHAMSESLVREACLLHRLSSSSTDYWRGWNASGEVGKFHTIIFFYLCYLIYFAQKLANKFPPAVTLRRHLGGSYLDLLQFCLNHGSLMHSRRAERRQTPRELMAGQGHPHWVTLLGLGPFQPRHAWPGEAGHLPIETACKANSSSHGRAVSARPL